MAWKKMTKAQKENYRKEKQKQTEKLIKDLDKKIDEFREMKIDSPEYKEFLKKISKFHNYSLNNLLLISLQNPNATFVAGYKTWQKEFNRQVVKGSKGIKILAPRIYKKEPETKAEIEEAKKLGVDKIERLYFNTINVFDVSDTKGEEFYLTPASPIIAKDKTPEDLDIIRESIESLYRHYGVELEYVPQEELGYATNGAYYLAEHKVVVSKDNTKEQQISTLIHEFTHSQLHSFDKMSDENKEGEVVNSNIREIQAQSISYAVCDFIGIDNSEYTFDYLANWGNSSNEELKQSLNIILKNSNKYINQIEDLIIEKTLEKENDKEVAIYNDKYKSHIKSEKIKYIEKYIPGMDSKEAKEILTNSSEIVVFTDNFKELEIDIKDHKIINQFGRGSSTDEPFIIEIENDNSKKTFIVDKNFKERRKSINEKQKDIEKENIKKSYEKLKKEYER